VQKNIIYLALLVTLLTSECLASVSYEALESPKAQAQRTQFAKISTQLEAGAGPAAKTQQQLAQLEDFILYPYLEYTQLRQHLATRPIKQISDFLSQYQDIPFTPTLRRLAITQRFKKRQWQDVLALHKEGNGLKYQCMQLTAMFNNGQKEQALSQVERIWLHGDSLPKICDPLLRAWSKSGKKSHQLILQRIELALIKRNSTLARYLSRSLPKKDKKAFDYWYKLYRSPILLKQSRYWQQRGHFANVMLNIALERLIYQRPELAAKKIAKIESHPGFTTSQRTALINRLSVRIITKEFASSKPALKQWLARLDWPSLNRSNQSQILRYLVGNDQWQHITALYEQLWQEENPPLAWRYWYANAMAQQGQSAQATKLYQSLAKLRRYYGFLASDKLKQPYQLNHQALPIDPMQREKLLNNPRLIRAYHLYKLNRNLEARREWYQLVKRLDEKQRLGAAQLANSWGWHDRAIITLTMTQYRDDLDLRFPQPYLESFAQEATRNEIDVSWPLAIARQESAFMTRANSAVGARGLMQLMPATAKIQAKRSRVFSYQRAQLDNPAMNIRLGTAYLERMLVQFDNNLAVAAAAYNAGPHRVKHWVKQQLPQDQWVETIPYRETREYVKNVLAYSVIYQSKQARKVSLPNGAISPDQMNINSK